MTDSGPSWEGATTGKRPAPESPPGRVSRHSRRDGPRFLRGICDNPVIWALAGSAGPVGRLIFRNIDYAPFTRICTAEFLVGEHGYKMIATYLAIVTGPSAEQERLIKMLGEALVPGCQVICFSLSRRHELNS